MQRCYTIGFVFCAWYLKLIDSCNLGVIARLKILEGLLWGKSLKEIDCLYNFTYFFPKLGGKFTNSYGYHSITFLGSHDVFSHILAEFTEIMFFCHSKTMKLCKLYRLFSCNREDDKEETKNWVLTNAKYALKISRKTSFCSKAFVYKEQYSKIFTFIVTV